MKNKEISDIMKSRGIALLCGFAIAALSVASAVASPPNLTGTWAVEQTGLNGTTTSTLTLTQSGMGLVGTNKRPETGTPAPSSTTPR